MPAHPAGRLADGTISGGRLDANLDPDAFHAAETALRLEMGTKTETTNLASAGRPGPHHRSLTTQPGTARPAGRAGAPARSTDHAGGTARSGSMGP